MRDLILFIAFAESTTIMVVALLVAWKIRRAAKATREFLNSAALNGGIYPTKGRE